jgi:hypothetical protein
MTKKPAKKRKGKSTPTKGARAAPPPPYKCQTTPVAGSCLRFNWNPADRQYNLPPGGILMNCADCQYFFD